MKFIDVIPVFGAYDKAYMFLTPDGELWPVCGGTMEEARLSLQKRLGGKNRNWRWGKWIQKIEDNKICYDFIEF